MSRAINPLTIYLASFPRAGSTWVRFLIANVYNTLRKAFDEIDFFNIHDIVPEFGSGQAPFFVEFPTVLKTHKHYRTLFRDCVLLLRDPYDLLYSYHDFITNNKKISIGLKEMIEHGRYGIRAVVRHTNSYVRNCEHLVILKYEGFKCEPLGELNKLFDFMGFPVSDDLLSDAVKKSSFLSMQTIEKKRGRKYGNPDFKHIRKGEIGVGRKELAKKQDLYHYIASAMKQSPVLHLLYQ